MPLRPPAGYIYPGYDPLKVPNAPTIGAVTNTFAGGQITVAFTAPANTGGGAVTSYLVLVKKTSDGSITTATVSSSPATVSGLTNGSEYTATVVAFNSFGPSVSSASSASVTPSSLSIGDAYGGGFYAGDISTTANGVATHRLVVAPVSSGQSTKQWKTTNTTTSGTSSTIDGPTNSANMNNASHPAAQFCEGLTIGGYTDWYMPAPDELSVCYVNLKPTTDTNSDNSGINDYSVPKRTTNYTSSIPGQTSVADFKSTGAEDFLTDKRYYSSRQAPSPNDANFAVSVLFTTGSVANFGKDDGAYVRAIRRVAI